MMVPKKKWPWWLASPWQLSLNALLMVLFVRCLGGPQPWMILVALGIAMLTEYLWAPRVHSDGSVKAMRMLPAGDPRPWQLWRWMDIHGPTGNQKGHEELYLRRLYVLRTPWFGVMLHWIKREDWDRDALHDHPWNFWRFIVSGGYTEELAYPFTEDDGAPNMLQPTSLVTRNTWSFSKFPSGAYHRITSVRPRTVSLVINGPKSNSWGFFVPGIGKVPWHDYVNGAR